MTHSKAGWKFSTISTRPIFVSVESPIVSQLDHLDTDQTYFLSLHQAKRVADSFRLHQDWKVRTRRRLRAGGFDAADDGEIVLDKLNEEMAWRRESAPNEAALFHVCREYGPCSLVAVQAEVGWATSPLSKAASVEDINGDQIWLGFPEDTKAKKVDPSRRLLMGTLSNRGGEKIDLRERWFLRSDLLAAAQIARDYGVALQGAFVKGSEGISGLAFTALGIRPLVSACHFSCWGSCINHHGTERVKFTQ